MRATRRSAAHGELCANAAGSTATGRRALANLRAPGAAGHHALQFVRICAIVAVLVVAAELAARLASGSGAMAHIHVHDHDCVHDSIRQVHHTTPQVYGDPGYDHVHHDNGTVTRVRRRRLSQDAWGNLRITPYFNLDGSQPAKEAYVRDHLVPAAIAQLSASLRVDRVVGTLKMSRPCHQLWVASGTCYSFQSPPACGHTVLPEDHIGDSRKCLDGSNSGCTTTPGGAGVADTDFVLYVTVGQTTTCGSNTLACT